MTSPPAPGNGSRLQFNSPLSGARADRLVTSLAGGSPGTVLDVGCGWGELLLRLLAAAPGATGTGIELHGPDLARARAAATARGLDGRVNFVEADGKSHSVASADDCDDLAGLVDHAVAAGFRPLRIETATTAEWEEFESGLAADVEEWLAGHPDHPEAGAVGEKLDAQRNMWLRGHRGVLGFAYLTLA